MEHGTTLLLGLEGVQVRHVQLADGSTRVVHVSTVAPTAAACPSCGVVSTSAKEHVTTRPKDLPYGQDPVELVWHKRRWRCREPLCSRSSFTESIAEVPPRARITRRLCRAVAAAVEDGRCVDEVARSHRVSWPTVQRAVDAHAALALGEPNPVALLGIDETRFGSPRWVRQRGGGWARTDPWETGFVDLSGAHGLLGQVDGRTSGAVVAWLNARGQDWKDAVQVVAIDPAAGYRTAVGQAMPQATLVVDHFHLVALANKALTRVRQRVTRDTHGRRGHATDPAWANRRLLLRARERLSDKAFARMWNGCLDTDPSGQILAAWIAKEELRALLGCAATRATRHEISNRLTAFYAWCADADIPELTSLAHTIQAWWPQVLAFLHLGITNATTEGVNRLIKQVKRSACGFRNRRHYHDRVRLHCNRKRHPETASRTRLPG